MRFFFMKFTLKTVAWITLPAYDLQAADGFLMVFEPAGGVLRQLSDLYDSAVSVCVCHCCAA